MKKLLIASLIASTSLMAVADETTLYGSIGYNTSLEKSNDTRAKDALKNNRWNLDTDELHWGIKGEENISDNLTAFWKMEFGDGGVRRYAYVGLKGDSWSTFTLGTQDSLVKVVTDYNDIFDAVGFWGDTTKYAEQLDRPDRVISYVSPNWSGFQFGLAGILNGKDGNIVDTGLDSTGAAITQTRKTVYYADPNTGEPRQKELGSNSFGAGQIGLWYNNYGFYAGLAYQYASNDLDYYYTTDKSGITNGVKFVEGSDAEIIAAAVGYKNDNFKVGLTEKHLAGDGDKLSLAGEYYFGPHTIRAGIGYANSDGLNYDLGKYCYDDKVRCGSKSVYTYALGYKYNLSKRTYTYIEGLYIDYNTKDKYTVDGVEYKNPQHQSNGYNFKVGLRHDF